MGGEEHAFFSLLQALAGLELNVEGAVRRASQVAAAAPPDLVLHQLSYRNVFDPLAMAEIRRLIRARTPEILQTYMGRATRLTRLYRLRHRPFHIARLCGHYAVKNFRHADAWIVCTRWVADYLIRGGVDASKVYRIPNFLPEPRPVDASELRALRQHWRVPEAAKVVAAIGRLVPVKGTEVLLNAFARLPRQIHGRELLLVIAGDGPQRRPLEHQASALGIADRVRFVGWQDASEPVYALADVVAFTSHAREGFGLVVLEAWSTRTPLVTTRSLGPLEITEHGEDALQVDCGDAAALADALGQVLKDQQLAADLCQNGSRKFQSTYTEHAVAQQYLDLYRALLGS